MTGRTHDVLDLSVCPSVRSSVTKSKHDILIRTVEWLSESNIIMKIIVIKFKFIPLFVNFELNESLT